MKKKKVRLPVEDFVDKFLRDPRANLEEKEEMQTRMASHLNEGMRYQQQGLYREAIKEFEKENTRPITSNIDKEIVEGSYWHIGMAYKKLGDLENAKKALQRARQLFNRFQLGVEPHFDLAKILVEEGKLDEAIEVCQEKVNQFPHGATKHLLEELLAKKSKK